MGLLLRDALRRLCVEIGWSYAVFWRAIGFSNTMHLVWEDGHCKRSPGISGFGAMDRPLKERAVPCVNGSDRSAKKGSQVDDTMVMLVWKKMASQVHLVGQGVIGQAALTGTHQWILRDMHNSSAADFSAEMNPQFLAGMQTIVIIPVRPFGVLQLGSTELVIENIGFINHVRCLFSQIGSIPRPVLCDATQKALSKNNQNGAHASPGIPACDYPSADFSTKAIGYLTTVADECNQFDLSLASRSVTPCTCSSFAHLNGKIEPSVSKVPITNIATTSIVTSNSEMFLPTADPVVKPGRLDDQPESRTSGAQLAYTNACVESNLQASAYGLCSGYENDSSAATPGLIPSTLTISEKMLVSINKNGSVAKSTANDTGPPSGSCHSPVPMTDCDALQPFGRNKLLADANALRNSSSFNAEPMVSIKVPYVIPSISGTYYGTNRTIHPNGHQVIWEDSTSKQLQSKSSQSIVATGGQIQGNDLLQYVDPLFSTLPNCFISNSNPLEENHRYLNAETDDVSVVDSQKIVPEEPGQVDVLGEKSAQLLMQPSIGNDLFDALGIKYESVDCRSSSDMFAQKDQTNAPELDMDASTCITQLSVGALFDSLNYNDPCPGILSEDYQDQLLDAVVSGAKSGAKQISDDDVSCRTTVTNIGRSSFHGSSSATGWVASSEQMESKLLGPLAIPPKTDVSLSNPVESTCSIAKTEDCSVISASYKSQVVPWFGNDQNIKHDCASVTQCKQVDDSGKLNRKRARPGESPRPRPKDRQMIQDRVKELREIVPNGAKCSIDALLEKTIKHMLFLQSVTKHADKLKETGEPKIISKEGGLLLKDNFEGGATWAFEVGTQSMICPIIVEDLNPPRQMLVEMLCQEHGFFLEIADLIRGLGLTILKGVMEARDDKIWARFAVEANRDVTRMEIFLSLVRLLEPAMGTHIAPVGVNDVTVHQTIAPQSSIPATGLSDRLVGVCNGRISAGNAASGISLTCHD